MTSSSSDSEEEDEKRKLKEALDPCFLNVAKLSNGDSGSNEVNGELTEMPVSKRLKLLDDTTSNAYMKPYSLDVTPECQNFIAKQLGKSLDKNIKEVKAHSKTSNNNHEPVADSGIKLFTTSSVYLTDEDLQRISERQIKPKTVKSKHKKKKSKQLKDSYKSSESSSDSEEEKLKSAAVSADWIFNNPYS